MFMQNQTNATRKQSQNTSDVILGAQSLPHPELTAMMSMPAPLHFITTVMKMINTSRKPFPQWISSNV